jgi:hypothetical protein
LNLLVTVHTNLSGWQIRVRSDLDKAMAIPAIHSQLGHMDIVREGYRLNRLVTDARIFGRSVVPRGRGRSANNQSAAHRNLQREPVGPAWEEICHKWSADARAVPVTPPP